MTKYGLRDTKTNFISEFLNDVNILPLTKPSISQNTNEFNTFFFLTFDYGTKLA